MSKDATIVVLAVLLDMVCLGVMWTLGCRWGRLMERRRVFRTMVVDQEALDKIYNSIIEAQVLSSPPKVKA